MVTKTFRDCSSTRISNSDCYALERRPHLFLWQSGSCAGRAGHFILLWSSLSCFFAAYSPKSLDRSSPDFPTCLSVTQIYKVLSEIWDFGSPETFLHNFRQLRDVIVNFSGAQRDIKQKMALQTAIISHMHIIFGLHVHIATNRTGVSTHRTGGHKAGHYHAF